MSCWPKSANAKVNWNGFRSKLNSVSRSGLHCEMMLECHKHTTSLESGQTHSRCCFLAPKKRSAHSVFAAVAFIINERTVVTFWNNPPCKSLAFQYYSPIFNCSWNCSPSVPFRCFRTKKKLPAPFARLDTPVSSSRDVTQPWLFGWQNTPRGFEDISHPLRIKLVLFPKTGVPPKWMVYNGKPY